MKRRMVELAINKNITMRQYNGIDYDTVYPKTIVEQVDGVYNKEQVVGTATKALFGLTSSAVPDDIFAAIGKYKQYWWRMRVPKTTGYIEVRTEVTNHHLVDYSDGSVSYSYGTSVSVDKSSGSIAINSPTTATFSLYGDFSVLKGKYVTSGSTIYYLPGDAVIKSYKDDDDEYVYVNTSQRITSKYVSGEAGSWQYIQSSDRSAYPDSGTQDGYEYEYLGVPFDNAVGALHVHMGTYTGSSESMQTVELGFTPLAVYVTDARGAAFRYSSGVGRFCGGLALQGKPATDTNRTILKIVDNGFQVNRDTSTTPYVAANYEGDEYYYIALGRW